MTALNRAKEAGERLEKLLPSISEESSDFIKYASEVYCLLGAAFENEPEKSTDYFEKGLAEAKARENIPTEEYCDFLKKASETAAKLNKYTKATEYLSAVSYTHLDVYKRQVYVGVYIGGKSYVKELHLAGKRNVIRERAAYSALDFLRRKLILD